MADNLFISSFNAFTMKPYNNFFFKLFLFAAVLVTADFLFGMLLHPVFSRQERGKYFTTSYALYKSSEDVIVLGNSHAAQHFNAARMTDSLHTGAFNFGNQSQSILYYYPLLESVLLHHSPRLVVLNLDPEELLYDPADYEKLSVLLPYLHENPYIDSAIYSIGPWEKYKAYSSFYRFNSTIGYIGLNLVSKSYGKSLQSKGFDPQDGLLCHLNIGDLLNGEPAKKARGLDPVKVRYLKQMITDLKNQNVNLLVTFAPVYEGRIRSAAAFDTLRTILKSNDVAYHDYYADARFNTNCALFHDQNHLNASGADKFTDLIIHEIIEKKLIFPSSPPHQTLASNSY